MKLKEGTKEYSRLLAIVIEAVKDMTIINNVKVRPRQVIRLLLAEIDEQDILEDSEYRVTVDQLRPIIWLWYSGRQENVSCEA